MDINNDTVQLPPASSNLNSSSNTSAPVRYSGLQTSPHLYFTSFHVTLAIPDPPQYNHDHPVVQVYETPAEQQNLPVNANDQQDQESSVPSYVHQEPTPPAPEEVKTLTPRKRPLETDDDDDDEGTVCPICYDNWTNTGDHRICSLKCGHIFGSRCIERWLTSQQKKSCPTCKKKVHRSDLRFIYARKLISIESTELVALKNENDAIRRETHNMSVEFGKSLSKEQSLKNELIDCKQKVLELTSKLKSTGNINSRSILDRIHMYMDKSLDVCKEGGCRVIDYSKPMDMIIASMKSPNTLFGGGYGIRKINLTNYKPTGFVHVHQKAIRDIKFHPQQPWILSVGLDNAVKVIDSTSNGIVLTYQSNSPLWSCCWDATNPYYLYAGEQQGSVLKYDIRELDRPVCAISVAGDMAPVVSLASIPSDPKVDFPHGGILCCKLNSVWVFKATSIDYSQRSLPMEGPFVSMSYQKSTRHLLVSTRPNMRSPYVRHMLCCIESNAEDNIVCNMVHSFQGGTSQKYLSRSCLFSRSTDYVAAHQETTKSVCLWSVSTGRRVCAFPAHQPILDICSVQTENSELLACLTEKKIEFFKFVTE